MWTPTVRGASGVLHARRESADSVGWLLASLPSHRACPAAAAVVSHRRLRHDRRRPQRAAAPDGQAQLPAHQRRPPRLPALCHPAQHAVRRRLHEVHDARARARRAAAGVPRHARGERSGAAGGRRAARTGLVGHEGMVPLGLCRTAAKCGPPGSHLLLLCNLPHKPSSPPPAFLACSSTLAARSAMLPVSGVPGGGGRQGSERFRAGRRERPVHALRCPHRPPSSSSLSATQCLRPARPPPPAPPCAA